MAWSFFEGSEPMINFFMKCKNRCVPDGLFRRLAIVSPLALLLLAATPLYAQNAADADGTLTQETRVSPSFIFQPPPFRFAHLDDGFSEDVSEVGWVYGNNDEVTVIGLYAGGLDLYRSFVEKTAWMAAPVNGFAGMASDADGDGFTFAWLPKAYMAWEAWSDVHDGPRGAIPKGGQAISMYAGLGGLYNFLFLDGDGYQVNVNTWDVDYCLGATAEIFTKAVTGIPYFYLQGVMTGDYEAELKIRGATFDEKEKLSMRFPGYGLGVDFRFYPFSRNPARFISGGIMYQRMSRLYEDARGSSALMINVNWNY